MNKSVTYQDPSYDIGQQQFSRSLEFQNDVLIKYLTKG